MTIPQKIYKGLVGMVGKGNKKAYVAAKWWHVLLLLIPILGMFLFVEMVEWAYETDQ